MPDKDWRLEFARFEGEVRDLLRGWLDKADILREFGGEVGEAERMEKMVVEAQARLFRAFRVRSPGRAEGHCVHCLCEEGEVAGKDEVLCAYYENPEHLEVTGPGRKKDGNAARG